MKTLNERQEKLLREVKTYCDMYNEPVSISTGKYKNHSRATVVSLINRGLLKNLGEREGMFRLSL